jgi:hypothetical protein
MSRRDGFAKGICKTERNSCDSQTPRPQTSGLEKKYDEQFRVVFEAIRQLMINEEKPKRRIGF